MLGSDDRFLQTHVGSLPRPKDLIQAMFAKVEGIPVDLNALAQRVKTVVSEIAENQISAGIDIVNDGEMSKARLRNPYQGLARRLWRRMQKPRLSGCHGIPEDGPMGVQ